MNSHTVTRSIHAFHDVDVELVKLVKLGAGPKIVHAPVLVQAHLFYMRSTAEGWQLVKLDGPDPALGE